MQGSLLYYDLKVAIDQCNNNKMADFLFVL